LSPIADVVRNLVIDIATLTARLGRQVDVSAMGILDRSRFLPLGRPGLVSPNGACRLFRASDGWMAANFARDEDRELASAWLSCTPQGDLWDLVARYAPRHTKSALAEQARLLGLPVASVGEVTADKLEAPFLAFGKATGLRKSLSVVDLSALWAGPLCGAILGAAGATVSKFESVRRPDLTRHSSPDFFLRLNSAKRFVSLDLADQEGRSRLRDAILTADVLITSARPRAFAAWGIDPEQVFATNPSLVWVAITGYGWTGAAATRVAFGDDAAAAGGLVRWTKRGAPRFLGDALADPLTGLVAAVGALRALQAGGGVLVDVSLAQSAAAAASYRRIRVSS